MVAAIRSSVFYDGKKYCPQFFLDKWLYKLQMLKYDSIDVSEGFDVQKNNGSRECIICHYWYFLKINFNGLE